MPFITFPFNTRPFMGGSVLAEAVPTDFLTFNDLSLSDGSVVILQEFDDSPPSRDIIGGEVPRGHGMYHTAAYYKRRVLTARGIIKKGTAELLEAYLDTFRQSLGEEEAVLEVKRPGLDNRQYVATLLNPEELFAARKGSDITVCPWFAKFECRDPFGKARDYTSQVKNVTTSPQTDTITNGGTFEAEPQFVIVFNAASGVTELTVKNDTNGQQITLTMSLAAGDVVRINCEEKTVTKNGVDVDYTGFFPSLEVGENTIRYTTTGSSWDFNATIKYRKTYL